MAKKFKHYTKKEKEIMVALYETFKSCKKAAKEFGCASSTIYYTVNPDNYEHHKEHVYCMRKKSSH